jgi:hypothetical protein
VSDLRKVFGEQYNYETTTFKLNSQDRHTPQVQLLWAVASFVEREDGEHRLLIVYYAGHGSPGKHPGDLNISG